MDTGMRMIHHEGTKGTKNREWIRGQIPTVGLDTGTSRSSAGRLSSSSGFKSRLSAFALLGLLLFTVPAFAQTDGAALLARLKSYNYGKDQTLQEELFRWSADAARDPSHRAEAAEGLAGILKSDAKFDAKELACRDLVLVAGDSQVPVLAGLINDDQLGHYALYALARIPGAPATDAMLAALPRAYGRIQQELIDALGDRGDPRAVGVMEKLPMTDRGDPTEAVAKALAKMADPAAVIALRAGYKAAGDDHRTMWGYALASCADRLRAKGDSKDALAIYETLDRPTSPAILRAAALRGMGLIRGENAVPMVLAALSEDGTPRQAAAARLARELPGKDAGLKLSEGLPKLTPRGQRYLLEALAERGDPAAAPVVMALCRSDDTSVRSAAVHAMGSVGDAASIPVLLDLAASGPAETRAAARSALSRVHGADIDRKLLAAAETGPSPSRAEAIKALGARGGEGLTTVLLRAAQNPDAAVSASALRVLRESADPAQLPGLIDIMLAAPAGSRDEAIETVSEVARRSSADRRASGILLDRLAAATKPADRRDLLTIMAQVGGPEAFAALRKGESDSDADVRAASLRLLAEWPSDEPMADLLRTVKTAQSASERAVALRGYIRMVGMNENRTPDQTLGLYRDALAIAAGADEKRLVLSGLAKLASIAALEYAARFVADKEVAAEAELAVAEIGRGTAGAYREKTRAALQRIAQNGTNEQARKRAGDVLALMDRYGDYITAWEVSPSYQRDGADYSKLFDMAFPPEEGNANVAWRLLPAGTTDQPWLIDLLAMMPGEQKVAYLRTSVWSDSARDVTLELGSDDGIKAWLNGQVVVADNTARAVAPGQEKAKVQLKPGRNPLMLKVTQNVMGWGAVARITNPDGTPATGLKYAPGDDRMPITR